MTKGRISNKRATPFLKWAGGKRWFTEKHLDLLPKSYSRYIEPFLGSGAVFFSTGPDSAILSDLNPDLIATYRAIRDTPERVQELLEIHHGNHDKDYYYKVRGEKPADELHLAAWFLYLNRTCFNGLYRVNQKNEFNVPIGTKTQVILPTDDFISISKMLSKSKIACADFEETINMAAKGDFVFVDPPYTVKHNLNGFLKYNQKIFSWEDQIRLRDSIVRAVNRGAMVMVTNANHQSVRDLYKGVGQQRALARSSVLAASSSFRASVDELMVRTWL